MSTGGTYDELLFVIDDKDDKTALEVNTTPLAVLGMHERSHLQEWILANPKVLGPDVKIVASEFDRWQTATGAPVNDRLDILGLDLEGRLVIVELKVDLAPHLVQMQAINYAAMASRLTPEDVAGLYAIRETAKGRTTDVDAARTELTTRYLLTEESIKNPRIILIAAGFPASVTSAVVWLNEQGVDISLIRFRTYVVSGKPVIHFSRLYPVPDVEAFTIGRRADKDAGGLTDPGAPWDETALRRLTKQCNQATRTLLDLCAAEEPGEVVVADVVKTAGISVGAVRGQLAGLTMLLKNTTKYGFTQNAWPVTVTWLSGGLASYSMDPVLAKIWRTIQSEGEIIPPISASGSQQEA